MSGRYSLPENLSDVDVAWAAGLVIGEGSVGRVRSTNASGTFEYIGLQLGMYDRRAIARFASTFGIVYLESYLKHRRHWFYKVYPRGRTAEKILSALWPHIRGTDKGDQLLRISEDLGLRSWVTGKRCGERSQLQRAIRGRRTSARRKSR